jgi:hypothetical protein
MLFRPMLPIDFGKGTARTANPVQTTCFFGVIKGFCRTAVDGENPIPDWIGFRGFG